MIKIKRIKNLEDLKDALCMIHEDMCTFKLANVETRQELRNTIAALEEYQKGES